MPRISTEKDKKDPNLLKININQTKKIQDDIGATYVYPDTIGAFRLNTSLNYPDQGEHFAGGTIFTFPYTQGSYIISFPFEGNWGSSEGYRFNTLAFFSQDDRGIIQGKQYTKKIINTGDAVHLPPSPEYTIESIDGDTSATAELLVTSENTEAYENFGNAISYNLAVITHDSGRIERIDP